MSAWGSSSKPPSSLYKAVSESSQQQQQPRRNNSVGSRGSSGGGRGRGRSNSNNSGGRGGRDGGRGREGRGGRDGGGGRSGGRGGRGGGRDNSRGGGRDGGGGRGRGRGNNNNNAGGRGGQQQQQQQQQGSPPQQQQGPPPISGASPSQTKRKQAKGGEAPPPQLANVTLTPWDEIVLLNTLGSGTTDAEKAIARVSVAAFMTCRLQHVDTPPTRREILQQRDPATKDAPIDQFYWTPVSRVLWTSRQAQQAAASQQQAAAASASADSEDAPATTTTTAAMPDRLARWQADMKVLWDYKPLEINEATRWKRTEQKEGEELRRAVGILNKLSWTNLDKMTTAFLQVFLGDDTGVVLGNNIGKDAAAAVDKQLIHDCMALIVDKAMEEPHFAELYARFIAQLASVTKVFKKTILALCQEQFEQDKKDMDLSSAGETKEEEGKASNDAEYKAAQAKKKYIGLMQFIGELYKMEIMKGHIMITCLEELFVKADEEKLECFAKLMTTIGEKLDQEDSGGDEASKEDNAKHHLEHIWSDVHSMAGRPYQGQKIVGGPQAPSNRIKFLLQDLIDLRQNGWVLSQRQQDEKAKTLAQIHREVAAEELQQRRGGGGPPLPGKAKMARSQSAGTSLSSNARSGSFGNLSAAAAPPATDADGFQQVGKVKKGGLRRVQSDAAALSSGGGSSLERALAATAGDNKRNEEFAAAKQQQQPPEPTKTTTTAPAFLPPDECKTKMENVLKEYFVNGDVKDTVLSVDELVGASNADDPQMLERAAAVVSAGILLVLERKQVEVDQFVAVLTECLSKRKVPAACLVPALQDPLEFLRDIEIDAPRAPQFLAQMVADWMSTTVDDGKPALELACLDTDAPDYFKSDARPAEFAKLVLQHYRQIEGCSELTDAHVATVSKLMTDEDRKEHADVRAWLLAD